ncbi:hypothetical protein C1645_880231 [Glomus cerebriforme]|uniref:BTB/POZ domain-containing protein n=1 Tax=Glomus cerebriforme TaxID=658196 RepID=A0A397SD87_9GLOM|nr:hypothetical protein C1645_880231 [Glomus cerebriforme]
MTSVFHSGLLKDISLLLNDADNFDTIIQVGEHENIREFRVHSLILRARSYYFKCAFATEWITKKDNMIMFNKPNITPIVFDMILKYIYTGELDLTNYQSEIILRLLVASDELLIEELFNHVQDYLIEKRTTWVNNNFILVLHSVYKLASCEKLRNYCYTYICNDPKQFFTSKKFLSLDKDIFYSLLERDDLLVEEILIWDCLIKWGIEQTPGLRSENSDRSRWNNENYEELMKTLYKFIPLIRFVDISPTDYFDKVRPYKGCIPNYIYEEIEEFYIKGTLPTEHTTLSPRVGNSHIISKIIKPEVISNIVKYINIKSTYNFDLIYRGNQDGIKTNLFRNKCKLHLQILVLVKCKNSQKIFGGYTPVGFYNTQSKGYISSKDSFIFSFDKDDNMQLSHVTIYNMAIYNFENFGFNFGGGALSMKNCNLNVNNVNTYKYNMNFGYGTYIIEEIEAFKLVLKPKLNKI